MHKPTNAQEEEHFIAFLVEGLTTLNANTPTYINKGGCGYFAKLLSEQLTQHGIEHQILAIFPTLDNDQEKEWFSNFKKFLAGNASNLRKALPEHIVVQIGELCFDATGTTEASVLAAGDRVYPITMEQLNAMLAKGDDWNPIFDKDLLPDIKERLEKMFNSYDNFHHGSFGKFPTRLEASKNTIRAMERNNPLAGLASIFG